MPQETMSSRQRVLCALDHQQPDRVPIDLGMHYSTGISAFAYHHLREYLGLDTSRIEVPDLVQFLSRVEDDVLQRFHCDCKLVMPRPLRPTVFHPRDEYRFIVPDTFQPQLNARGEWIATGVDGGRMRMPKGGFFFDGDWPSFQDCDDEIFLARAGQEAEKIFHESDYFTMFQGVSAIYEEKLEDLVRIYDEPEEVLDENQRKADKAIEKAKRIIHHMGDHIQGICMGSDLGTQQAPMMSPAMYEEFYAPFVKQVCRFIHDNSDYRIFFHCCGSIRPMIPILIDCGIDVLNPVQHSAANMDPATLKADFGDRITFWGGGVNCQQILPRGTLEDIRADVRRNMEIFKPGGGFVFNPIHNIMGDIVPEKVVALYDEAYFPDYHCRYCY